MTPLHLQGRGAIVAGGGGGIGRAVCTRLMEAGAQVVSLDREGHAPPAGAESIACDLTQGDAVTAALESAGARLGDR